MALEVIISMIFNISSSLKFGYIFAGKIDAPMYCELDLSKDYYLIYSNLQVGKNGLNLSNLFEDAFKIPMPLEITIEKGGFFTFSPRSSSLSENVKITDVFPNAPIPKTVKEYAKPVQQTTSFWASFNFRTSGLFKTLIDIGYDEKGSEVSLCGTFASGEVASETIQTTEYKAYFERITLIQLFEFTDLTLTYRFDQSSEYRIQGYITLKLFGNNYKFFGHVNSTSSALKACVRSADPNSKIVQPFGGLMRGVTFESLMFGLSYTYETEKVPAKSLIRIQGKINYQADPNTNLDDNLFTGQIFLQGSNPIVAAMLVERDVDIGAIFNNSIGGGNLWPTSFVNIVFHKGSQLYFCDVEHDPKLITDETFECSCGSLDQEPTQSQPIANPVHYNKGFNLYAHFDITILLTIRLTGTVTIGDEGVSAEIQLADWIDLWVLQLTAPQVDEKDSTEKGPIFCFNSKENLMGFKTNILFFQADFGVNVSVQADKADKSNNDMRVSGEIEPAQAHLPFLPKGAKLSFKYDSQNGFTLNGWEQFQFVKDILDFAKEVEEFSNKTAPKSCGAIVDFIMDKTTETDYRILPKFVTDGEGTGAKLYLSLGGTYTLYLGSGTAKVELFTLDFPDAVRFLVPKDLSFDNLGGYIETAIKEAGSSFAEGILKNEDAIAILLSVFAGKQAAKYAATLLCKNLAEPSLPSAASAGQAAFSSGSAGGAGVAIGVAAAFAVIGGITGGSGSGGSKKPGAPDQPTNLKLNAVGEKVTATWQKVNGIDHYLSQVFSSNTKPILQSTLPANETCQSFNIDMEQPSGIYYYAIKTVKAGKSSDDRIVGIWKPEAPKLKVCLDIDSIQHEQVLLLLSWNKLEDTATYELRENNQPRVFSGADQCQTTSSFTQATKAGDYSFKIMAKSDGHYIQTNFSPELIWQRLSMPDEVKLTITSNKVKVVWQWPSAAARFLVRATFEEQGKAQQQTSFNTVETRTSTEFDIPNDATFESVTVSVRAVSTLVGKDEIPSQWSNPSTTPILPDLSPEEIAKRDFDAGEAGKVCATDILASYPDIKPDDMAIAMEQGGYPVEDTRNGLLVAYPNITAEALAQALVSAYGKVQPTLEELVETYFEQGKSGQECGTEVAKFFPDVTPKELAGQMKQAGYTADQTRDGLLAAFPNLTALQIAQLLASVYGKET